jgi:hypothetical protein
MIEQNFSLVLEPLYLFLPPNFSGKTLPDKLDFIFAFYFSFDDFTLVFWSPDEHILLMQSILSSILHCVDIVAELGIDKQLY